MNALLAETMIRREFDLYRNDLSKARQRELRLGSLPDNKNSTAADILGVHFRFHPDRRRSHMAPELDFYSRTLPPIYGFHFGASTLANLAPAHRERKAVKGLYPFAPQR